MVPLTTFFVLTLQTFIYCYFGSRLTIKSNQFSQSAYDALWYLLSAQRQNVIKMILIHDKYELYYSGNGFVICSLETFGQVSAIDRFSN